MQNIQIVQPGAAKTRVQRRPNFAIQGGIAPMGLFPNFFAPVLPGETLDSHNLKATMVSAPIANPLGGSWLETWLFHVKLTDLDPDLAEMFIGTLTDSSAYQAGEDQPQYFTKTGQIEWVKLCTEFIHSKFFINEGETPITHPDGVPMIKRINSDAFESMVQDQDGETDGTMIGDSEGEEITPQMEAYLKMKQIGMGIQSYDDYLKTYGLKSIDLPKRGEPELLSYRRYWSLPSNVIDPTDGSPTGAWYWRLDEKNEKNKRFTEPGFVIGYWAVRPKFLDSKIVTSLASSLWGFEDWIPSYTLTDPAAGIKRIDMNAQPWVTEVLGSAAYAMFDLRDLHSHGEQFRNGLGRYTPALSSYRTWSGAATEPQLRGEYVNSTDLDAIWLASGTARDLDYDGIVSMTIKGHVMDRT